MRRNLQSKFNLLGVTLIVFALLMVPMFNQVKADTRGSLKEAKNTWMSKMFREVSRDFKARDLGDQEVEDYWAEQVKQNNEDCRNDPNNAKCNADGDLDGDGVSNGDEVRQGRNPSCNEETMGDDYCRNADKFNVTEPDPTPKRVEKVLVFNKTWVYGTQQTCPVSQTQIPTQCTLLPFDDPLPANVTLLESYLNATKYQGTGFSGVVRSPSNNNALVLENRYSGFEPQPRSVTTPGDSVQDPKAGTYTAQILFNTGQGQSAQGGVWHMQVWATVVS